MFYEFIARDRINEAHREAEKARLIEKARKDRSQKFLNTILCRFGLVSTC
jgi:hypothetical protein